jgi:hypothetical protein
VPLFQSWTVWMQFILSIASYKNKQTIRIWRTKASPDTKTQNRTHCSLWWLPSASQCLDGSTCGMTAQTTNTC